MSQNSFETISCRVQFLNPAFLGNAEQGGQWRTPPFKALLRQWWRVVWAAEHGFPQKTDQIPEFEDKLRECEAQLFGTAANQENGGGSRKSLVRVRLDSWSEGKDRRPDWVTNDLHYLGYGPLTRSDGKIVPAKLPVVSPSESEKRLSIAAPSRHINDLKATLWLMNHFGTIGGRSRNGWGSLELSIDGQTQSPVDLNDLKRFGRPWEQALELSWAHCIGTSERGFLIWKTKHPNDWQKTMHKLAEIKKALRKEVKSAAGCDLKWLAWPVTKYKGSSWRNDYRLPNSLRFKICQDSQDSQDSRDTNDKLQGIIFHMPCKPTILEEPHDIESVRSTWEAVHQFLDKCCVLERMTEKDNGRSNCPPVS